MNFLQTLLNFSERASKLARTIRHDPCLFALLVEEKGELEKNARFLHDFKTLADVLIQESLRHYISLKFPNITSHVKGEENSTFTNTLGENINVCVCKTQKETASLLAKVLDGNLEAANALAEVVHEEVEDVEVTLKLKDKVPHINLDSIGIWIDPIDSTGEYINGKTGTIHTSSSVYQNGLPCVTVLVGVYDRLTGMPIAGVINQPFAQKDVSRSRWMSQIYWGLQYNGTCVHNQSDEPVVKCRDDKPVIVVSSNESWGLKNHLEKRFGVIHATGAGYKSLTVAVGLVEAYFCSMDSTYRWDTCAPHCILRSLGGGIISYKSLLLLGKSQLLSQPHLEEHQIRYHQANVGCSSSQKWCNKDGLVVYRSPDILFQLYESLVEIKEQKS